MHGFPQAIKDLEATAGIRTTLRSPLFKEFIPSYVSILVERIKGAGAIIIGKTNTPEFGLGSHSYNPVFGTTLNAYDQTKAAGGSSSGAAVALARRMMTVADGSDHAGSLRNPTAFNNVPGFRTLFGRVRSRSCRSNQLPCSPRRSPKDRISQGTESNAQRAFGRAAAGRQGAHVRFSPFRSLAERKRARDHDASIQSAAPGIPYREHQSCDAPPREATHNPMIPGSETPK